MTAVSFIIPVRHPSNMRDKNKHARLLSQTLLSLCAQSNGDWKCVVVANELAEPLPVDPRISFCRVDFPPNELHDIGSKNRTYRERSWQAVRRDKGLRVFSGVVALGWTKGSRFIMVVDDDDLLHRNLVDFISRAPSDASGYIITKGYQWPDGSSLLITRNRFDERCGTSLIPSLQSLELPENPQDFSSILVERWFGSHRFLKLDLENKAKPLQPVPFRAAIYRVAHANNHSSGGVAKSSLRLFASFWRIRFLIGGIKKNFFGLSIYK